jgi:hypothetical protein
MGWRQLTGSGGGAFQHAYRPLHYCLSPDSAQLADSHVGNLARHFARYNGLTLLIRPSLGGVSNRRGQFGGNDRR